MSLFGKRNLLVGLGTFLIGMAAFTAVWGLPRFMKRDENIKSQVAAYLLDERGAVSGLLLTSGDQLRFSRQTGEAVAARIRVGDEVTVTGRAGMKSGYGREVRVRQIAANGRTIIEVGPDGPGHRPEPRQRREPASIRQRQDPPQAEAPPDAKTEPASAPSSAEGFDKNENGQEPQPETFKAAGTIRAHLVNGHGDVDGLILSGGEQVRFSPKVGKLIVAAEQGTETQLSVEGPGVRSELGTSIRPALIPVGSQTCTLGR